MATPFEDVPYVNSTDDLLDDAFSTASRAAESNTGVDSQRAQTQRAANSLSGALEALVDGFPSFAHLDPPYDELAEAAVDVDEVRRVLGRVDGVSDQIQSVAAETQRELAASDSTQEAVDSRKRAFARYDSIVSELEDDLDLLADARAALTALPEIGGEATAVLAGAPNVGKSSLLRELTDATPEVGDYSFTTKTLEVGHVDSDDPRRRMQVVEAPGLLDRADGDRNEMERQTEIVLEEAADLVVWIYDASETCGYTVSTQRDLRREMVPEDVDVLEVVNKSDLATGEELEPDLTASAEEEGVGELVTLMRERLVGEVEELY